MQNKELKVLIIGDVFGPPGMDIVRKQIPILVKEHDINLVIVNGENSAKDGRGILQRDCEAFFEMGVDVITTGNHVWKYEQFFEYLDQSKKVIRPANFPEQAPGSGVTILEKDSFKVAVVNLMGRVFLKELVSCPFQKADEIINSLKDKVDYIFVDFHAEATAEKQALAFYLDGRVTGFWGTHTHVQTADERTLPQGTAYITDLGFCGAINSCIGVSKEAVIKHSITQMPARFKVEKEGPFILCGAIISVGAQGNNSSIKRIQIIQD